ncbi:MAG: zf-HC2 domain-containing protein [Bacillota bacterium]|nr:zf-HC2 domain-containing protein [Bacillota bacterium]
MNCERVRNLISAYLDRELAPEESRLIRAHLVACADCNEELEAEAALKRALGDLESEEAPADFLPSLLDRLRGEEADRRWRLPACALWWVATGAAAALLLALPLVRQWRSGERVVEAHFLYRQHAFASASRPLADRVLTSYYYAVAGEEDDRLSARGAADRVRLVGQSLPK